MKHATLVGATGGGGSGRSSVPMDVRSIASVADAGAASPGDALSEDWATEETGWSIYEEGWPLEGYIDGQLNFVKGGKGKGSGECWNCGKRDTGPQAVLIRHQQERDSTIK